MKKAKSYNDIVKMNFKTMAFEGRWKDFIGTPECSGAWIIWGKSGSGKTRLALELAKYLGNFERVFYNSLEEGMRLSFQRAVKKVGMPGKRFICENEKLPELKIRLLKKRSPKIIIIDSLQYLRINKRQFEALIDDFPNKLFIFISHAQGDEPKGGIADEVRYNADVKIHVKGYRAFPVSRYGGDKTFTIWEAGAEKYWGLIEKNQAK